MYTYTKFGSSAFAEKTVTRHGDNYASVHIEMIVYEGKVWRVHVYAFASPFGEESRSHSQFFEGAGCLREAWSLFKGFQTILGGGFCDE